MWAQVSQIPVTIKVIFWQFTFYILQQKVILHYEKEIWAVNMQIHEPSYAESLACILPVLKVAAIKSNVQNDQ